MFCPRKFIRQRWVLAAILGTSVIYFCYNMFGTHGENIVKDRNLLQIQEEQNIDVEKILRMLKWNSPGVSLGNSSWESDGNGPRRCRNSVQGKELIADDKGYVCRRDDTTKGGCCDTAAFFTNRYACDTCIKTNCCMIYEHCVSCCMQPDKKQLLERIIRSAVDSLTRMMFFTVHDQFELCLSKCRTSSRSVQHENTYRDAERKHCFGVSPPELRLGGG